MSTVISTKEMFPVFETLPTTTEEVMTLIDSFITKFLEIADFLEIKSEEEHTYGKYVYIGEKEKDFPIMVIGNSNNATYYSKGILLNRIEIDGKVSNGTINVTGLQIMNYVTINFSTAYPVNMKYLKTSKGMFCKLSFADQTPLAGTMVLTPMVTDGVEGEFLNYLLFNNKNMYNSFIPHSTFDSLTETLPEVNSMLIPTGKYGVMDVYAKYNNVFPYLKLISWYPVAFTKYEIGEKKYAAAFVNNQQWSVLMEIE